jgi:hypothetical protein
MSKVIQTLMVAFLWTLSSNAMAGPTVDELLLAADNMGRGEHSIVQAEMHVKTARYERKTSMTIWASGKENTLIKITAPAKSAGMATLKVDQNIWNFMPRSGRTMKIPSGMMGGNWMGSHFSNDDLVKESRMSDDFDAEIVATPDTHPKGHYVIVAIPKPDAPVVWGKIEAHISSDRLPVSFLYYDESGTLMRTMEFSDVRMFDGQKMPAQMKMSVSDKPGEFTMFTYQSVDFSTPVLESTFTKQSLRR